MATTMCARTTGTRGAALLLAATLLPLGLGADHEVLLARASGAGVVPPGAVHYDVTFNQETAANRLIHVEMTFMVDGAGAVALSIPAWTPGSYQLDNFARHVRDFAARQGGDAMRWDKADHDTWRVYPSTQGEVAVSFDYRATSLDVGMSWSTDDFAFFNGTNLFPFFEGHDLGFSSTVTFHTEAAWSVATGLTRNGSPTDFRAESYHELVDMPTVIGRFTADSREIGGRRYHLATYPADAVSPASRREIWDQIDRMVPPMVAVFGETPWDEYTTLMVFDPSFPGGSALEHANSHLGVYGTAFIGSTILASITAHEIFHAWNVKRLRPADLWPYDYARAQPSELLWVSEGITDYYADLALVRGSIIGPADFYRLTTSKIQTVDGVRPVALEDASLSVWIAPDDGTASIYYPKGSLAGFALDILIRDASDNRGSLDDVLRSLYEDTYRAGEGFTEQALWRAVRATAPGLGIDAFHDAYIDGRVPFAWDDILPLAGLVLSADTVTVPRIGVSTQTDSTGIYVVAVVPGSSAADAGIETGDRILRVGDIVARDASYGARYRARYGSEPVGTPIEVEVLRDGSTVELRMELRFADNVSIAIEELPDATTKAARIRDGLLSGRVDP